MFPLYHVTAASQVHIPLEDLGTNMGTAIYIDGVEIEWADE